LKRSNIKNLLDKYVQGKLDRDELDFLFHSINHHLHDEEILAWYYRYWDEAETRTKKIKSSAVFNKIKEQLNAPEAFSRKKDFSDNKQSVVRKIFLNSLKFAAIFVIGFFLAAILFRNDSTLRFEENTSLNQVSIPLGSKSKIVLSDGSQVWLNSGSTIKYPGNFNRNRREIYFAGEAFFDIKRDESRPFIVRTSEINIKVLGTQFNVKSYPEENTVETTVISGSVEIETKPFNSLQKQHLKLQPNQKATFSKLTSELDVLTEANKPQKIEPKPVGNVLITEKINTEVVTAWKDDKLIFAKERFEDILTKLERWYDVDIILEDDKLRDYTYTGTFQKESLEQALDALKLATPFDYSIDKNNIIIYARIE
jgi:transmembrane sensor